MDHKNSNLVRTEVGAMIEEIVLTNADVVETIERYIQKLNQEKGTSIPFFML